jgi:hypothetical protein
MIFLELLENRSEAADATADLPLMRDVPLAL